MGVGTNGVCFLFWLPFISFTGFANFYDAIFSYMLSILQNVKKIKFNLIKRVFMRQYVLWCPNVMPEWWCPNKHTINLVIKILIFFLQNCWFTKFIVTSLIIGHFHPEKNDIFEHQMYSGITYHIKCSGITAVYSK